MPGRLRCARWTGLALCCALLCAASAGAQKRHPGFVYLQGTGDRGEFAVITEEHAAKLPKWTPDDGDPPPVTLQQALATLYPVLEPEAGPFPWDITVINLTSQKNTPFWYYAMRGYVWTDNNRPVRFKAYVLMDGTVLLQPIDLPLAAQPGERRERKPMPFNVASAEVFTYNRNGVTQTWRLSEPEIIRHSNWRPGSLDKTSEPDFTMEEAMAKVPQFVRDELPGRDWHFSHLTYLVHDGAHTRGLGMYRVHLRFAEDGNEPDHEWRLAFLTDGTVFVPDPHAKREEAPGE